MLSHPGGRGVAQFIWLPTIQFTVNQVEMKFTRVILQQFASALTNAQAKDGARGEAGLQKIKMHWSIKKKLCLKDDTHRRRWVQLPDCQYIL